jgi:4-hydroxymandelate oxidase
MFALTALRMAIGWHLLYEGIAKMLQGNWSSASYLSSSTWIFAKFFRLIAEVPWALKTVDIVNMWALAILGLCLVLGFLARSTALCSAGLLMLYYLAHPPFMAGGDPLAGPGSYLIIDHNLVESAALVVLALVRPGSLYGLDRLLFNRVTAGEKAADEKFSLDRRDVLTNLAGIPVLGALAAAVAVVHATGPEPSDTFFAGATPATAARGRSVQSGNIVSIRDYERLAPTKMSAASYEFVAGGAGDDQTVYWNQAAFQRIVLRPKMGVDVLKIDTRIQLFGKTMPHPIMLSPASEHGRLNPEGEKATARGAGAANAIMIVSTFATEKIEDIAKAASGPLWHAPYMFFRDRAKTSSMIQRAQASGYQAIVVPIDDPVAGARDREERIWRSTGKPVSYQSYPVDYYRYPATWADLEWYVGQTKLPLVVKGILNPDDAEQAIKVGAKAIFVSNHGGRNLDTAPATIDVLPAIVDRVAGRVPVFIDSGIRRGTDVLKALAYGATAVSIGRPYLYGLAVKGQDGVTGVINILRNELEMAMACVGRPTIASIDRSVVAGHLDFPNYTAQGQFWPN